MNYKGKYESFQCEACQHNEFEEESQKHIMKCKILNENKENIPDYEDIYNGNVEMKVKIAKHFLENIKTREKMNNMNQ